MSRRVLRLVPGALGVVALAACSNSQPAPQGQAVTYGQPAMTAQAPVYRPAPAPAAPTYASPYAGSSRMPAPPPPPAAPRMATSAPAYTQPAYTPPAYPQPSNTAPAYSPPAPTVPAYPSLAPASTGAWRWHTRIGDAQADARAQGKMILVTSTKPNCGLCEKFKGRIVPEVQSEVSAVAVGYVYDITAPEDIRVDRLLRGNLPGATLMPLVGFVTPELQWISGFYGQTDATQFRGDLEKAKARYPLRRAALPVGEAQPSGPSYAMVNEYGEYEWSPTGEVIPQDALDADEPAPALAADTRVAPPTPAAVASATWAPAPVAPAPCYPSSTRMAIPPPPPPPAWPADRLDPVATRFATAPAEQPIAAAPESFTPYVHPETLAAPVAAAEAAAPTPPAAAAILPEGAVASVRAPWSETSDPDTTRPAYGVEPEAWAETMLTNAMAEIQAGRLDEARITLTQVLARMSADSDLGLEAARGTVAVYNARKIEKAADADKLRLLEQARKDLGDSRWATLFD